jgi:hypothetical protein
MFKRPLERKSLQRVKGSFDFEVEEAHSLMKKGGGGRRESESESERERVKLKSLDVPHQYARWVYIPSSEED